VDSPSYLQQTRDEILNRCSGLSPELAQFRPEPNSWSVLEIIEDLAVVECASWIGIKRTLNQPEAEPTVLAETATKQAILESNVPNPTNKITAPAQTMPTGRFGLWPAALAAFQKASANVLEAASSNNPFLHRHVMPRPVIGLLTLAQWLFFAAAHAASHTIQIEQVLCK